MPKNKNKDKKLHICLNGINPVAPVLRSWHKQVCGFLFQKQYGNNKTMKYFLHDTNSFSDEKITELFIEQGYKGLGLFYTALEKIALQEKPIKTKILKQQLGIGKRLDKCWSKILQLELIVQSNDECFNTKLLSNNQKYLLKKESTKIRVANFRQKQRDVTRYSNKCNTHKEKKRKEKKRKENTIAETSSAEIIPSLLNDKNKHIQIIGLYAKLKEINFTSKEQQSSFIKRNLRASVNLKPYPIDKIIETMKYLKDNADFKVTLESVGKFIDEDLTKLNNKPKTIIL